MHAHNYEDNISTHPKDDIDMLKESVVAESQPSSGFYSMVNTMHFQLMNEDDMITKNHISYNAGSLECIIDNLKKILSIAPKQEITPENEVTNSKDCTSKYILSAKAFAKLIKQNIWKRIPNSQNGMVTIGDESVTVTSSGQQEPVHHDATDA